MKKALTVLSLCYLCMVGIAASAHIDDIHTFDRCNVEIDSDISINPEAIEIESRSGKTLKISKNHDLFVDDAEVELSQSERELVKNYAGQVRETVPEIVAVALEGVEVGLTAVSEVFYAISEDGPPEPLLKTINSIQEEVAARMHHEGNTVHIKGGEIHGLEATMRELEPALEDAIPAYVGDLLLSIATSLKDGEGSIAERMGDFTTRMERFEEDIEQRVSAKAESLENRAEGLCENVYALQASESELHMSIPATRPFNLVKDS